MNSKNLNSLGIWLSPGCRSGFFLIAVALFLIVFGVRLSIVAVSPYGPVFQYDDFRIIEMVNSTETGQTGFAGLFGRYSDQHRIGPTLVMTWLATHFNEGFDLRLVNIFYATLYATYAGVCFILFSCRAGLRGRWVTAALVLALFLPPWETSMAAWPILSCFTFTGIFSLLAIGAWVYLNPSISRTVVTLGLILLSSFSCGAGVLCGPAIAGLVIANVLLERRRPSVSEFVLLAGCAALLFFSMTGVAKTDSALSGGMGWKLIAFLKSLAWPLVFTAVGALLQIIPFSMFGLHYLKHPEIRGKEARFLLAVLGFLILNCLAIGFYRGENNNQGMPSLRYWQLLMLMPFAVFRMLAHLRRSPNRPGAVLTGIVYGLALIAGLGLQFFLRVVPFVTNNSGDREWMIREHQLADMIHSRLGLATSDVPALDDAGAWVTGQEGLVSGISQMLTSSIVKVDQSTPVELGFSVSKGFAVAGVPPGYPHDSNLPALWGSYRRAVVAPATFISEPFVLNSPSCELELLFTRKAKFGNYRLPGLSLFLKSVDGNEAIDLIAACRQSFPGLLRAQERVCVSVRPGESYRIEAQDESEEGWIAFSEPWARGKLGPATCAVYNSCWLFTGAGGALIGLVVFSGLAFQRSGVVECTV